MTGHTAGKWIIIRREGHPAFIHELGGEWIAECRPDDSALICAAPLLLEELIEAREFVDKHFYLGIDARDESYELIAKIDSAIAAATRRET